MGLKTEVGGCPAVLQRHWGPSIIHEGRRLRVAPDREMHNCLWPLLEIYRRPWMQIIPGQALIQQGGYFIRGGLCWERDGPHVLVNLAWHTDCSADRLVNERTPAATRSSFLHRAIMSRLGPPGDTCRGCYAAPGGALLTHVPISGLDAPPPGQPRFWLAGHDGEIARCGWYERPCSSADAAQSSTGEVLHAAVSPWRK